jgi:formate dehydrogenase iron-sulfur subunit
MHSQPLVFRSNQARHEYVREGRAVGFFTDPTVCIGCKACEVACKEWNDVPARAASPASNDGRTWTGHSYDNTVRLGASTWRHVKFVELDRALRPPPAGVEEPVPGWLFLSDVCKHCEHAGS